MSIPSRTAPRRSAKAPARRSASRPAKKRQADDSASGTRPLILVADDFTGAREVYARLLTASGYRVAQAASGMEAIEKSIALQPALVLMDLIMPGVDGWEAIRQLRSDSRTHDTRIVVITASTNSEAAQNAKRAGCDAFLLKPTLPETLLEVVRGVLAKRAT